MENDDWTAHTLDLFDLESSAQGRDLKIRGKDGETRIGAYPCRFRQVSWWGFGGGSGVTETDENDRRLPLSAEVP
jgi:hypothetical protein